MMNTEEIQKLAELSRLTLSENEIESYKKDFIGILEYIDTIKNIKVENTTEANSFVIKNVMREDTNAYPAGTFTEELLNAAPRNEGDYIKVNKVL